MASQDALLAQLLGMGFQLEQIQEYQRVMSESSKNLSLQEATEWLLQQQQTPPTSQPSSSQSSNQSSGRLVLTTPLGISNPVSVPSTIETTPTSESHDFQRAISSSKDLTSPTSPRQQEPMKSRYNVSEDHVRDRERFAAKERQEAVKRAKEMRLAEMKAKQKIKKQIADDRKARQDKFGTSGKKPDVSPTITDTQPAQVIPSQDHTHTTPPTSTPATCRVQVRLPNGQMLRHIFPSSATLNDVATFVSANHPQLSLVKLVQPFPHHEFTSDESGQTLLSLGLTPSASLVVSKPSQQEVGGAGVAMDTTKDQSGPSSSKSSHVGSRSVQFQEKLNLVEKYRGQHASGMSGRGHVLGGGASVGSEEDRTTGEESMVVGGVANEGLDDDMEIGDESHSHSSDDDDDGDGNVQPLPLPPNMGPPPGFGRMPPNFPRGRGRGMFIPPLMPGRMFGGGDDDSFGGTGHRLGGKETPPTFGEQLRVQEAAKSAALKRSHVIATPLHPSPPSHCHIPPLEYLCTRVLVTVSRTYGLPSCSILTPLVGQRLMAALIEEKRLNTKTLASFHGCPLQVLNLDNYAYATNELLSALCYFPSLARLSLGSCTIITDKAVVGLLPYLSGLKYLSLNGCRQLNEPICRVIRNCKQLEVLKLSQVKISDKGVSLLLHHPLESLIELDLSHTLITSQCLQLLLQGAPHLEVLSVDSTQVNDLSSLSRLPRLQSLSLAHCRGLTAVGSLAGCHGLQFLSLAGITVETNELRKLTGLRLHSLTLPDRNTFTDEDMEVVCGFPLTSLNLMDYCHITDVGISHIPSLQSTLISLSLSRTKLTDQGMVFLEGLHCLRELSLDNTLVTDDGMNSVRGLVGLDVLSLSDTRVTSQFISDGVLDKLSMLTKLNLSRTAVCDKGISQLRLASLVMLNLNWTSVTEQSSLEAIKQNGCPVLETLRNRNIGQPLPGQQPTNEDQM